MGLGTARAWVQSKGRLVRDQMTGWTFWVMFSEMATMEHVSCRTATRLGKQMGQPGVPACPHPPPQGHRRGASPGPRLVGLKQDKQGGLVVAVQELQVDDVEQLLVQCPDVNDVAGQEAGPLPGG